MVNVKEKTMNAKEELIDNVEGGCFSSWDMISDLEHFVSRDKKRWAKFNKINKIDFDECEYDEEIEYVKNLLKVLTVSQVRSWGVRKGYLLSAAERRAA